MTEAQFDAIVRAIVANKEINHDGSALIFTLSNGNTVQGEWQYANTALDAVIVQWPDRWAGGADTVGILLDAVVSVRPLFSDDYRADRKRVKIEG
jgi:hypothetical protein